MTTRNPKQDGTVLYDAVPQTGPCPNGCAECYYNRPGAFYVDIHRPHLPDPKTLPADAIVRMNSGHDSNLQRAIVLSAAKLYDRVFFNTSLPKFAFPGPVVFTANRHEETDYTKPPTTVPDNLMFVRLRVSPSNAQLVWAAVREWTQRDVPVVFTFMRYYDGPVPENAWEHSGETHTYRQHVLNACWCPTPEFMRAVLHCFANNRLVSLCGSIESSRCRDCRTCETRYVETTKRLRGE